REHTPRKSSMRRNLRSFVLPALVLVPGMLAAATAPTTPTYVLQWGLGGTLPGQFDLPSGIATDAAGNVYVADVNNHRMQKFDALGNLILLWGSPGSAPGLFNGPFGVAVDASGTIYVVDRGNNRMQKFTASGTFLAQWGSV